MFRALFPSRIFHSGRMRPSTAARLCAEAHSDAEWSKGTAKQSKKILEIILKGNNQPRHRNHHRPKKRRRTIQADAKLMHAIHSLTKLPKGRPKTQPPCDHRADSGAEDLKPASSQQPASGQPAASQQQPPALETSKFEPNPILKHDLRKGSKNVIHFSICACHPCAGAMLIFSVSFQF